MKLSAPVRYAVRILFALDTPDTILPIAELASRTGMSLRAAENVLAVLKQQDITGATSGPGGGIFLKTPLSKVSVGQLVDCFEQGVALSVCCGELIDSCPGRTTCMTEKAFQKLSRRMNAVLHQTYLSDILHAS